MTLSVRLPSNIEQQLAAYCAAHKVSKSEAVKCALERFLSAEAPQPTPYELGKDLFGADTTHVGDIARHSKRLLRERFRAKAAR